jgi:hypothetical protein
MIARTYTWNGDPKGRLMSFYLDVTVANSKVPSATRSVVLKNTVIRPNHSVYITVVSYTVPNLHRLTVTGRGAGVFRGTPLRWVAKIYGG